VKISGEATLHGPVQRVYEALNDPAVLVRTIPGCERLERTGPDAYSMVVSAGVAAIKGTYVGEVVLTDQQPPHHFVLKAAGSGGPGTVSAQARVRLADRDGATTTLTYDADAVVGGMVGGVGQRILTGVARRTADEFFAAVNEVLAGAGPTELAGAGPTEPAEVAATGGVPAAPAGAVAPAVFTRPPAVRAGADFARGVVFGAAAALAGVLVGAAIARRPR
jgi:carbon monoxide dehydrogenase subunit G